MKTILLLSIIIITSVAFAAPSSANGNGKILKPREVLIINIQQLKEETKDVSLLKPMLIIFTTTQNAIRKIHGKKLQIICNKSVNQYD